ncbi:MAG TPA: BlaI/MecI/CopY family transcriptional regulator [Abditibacterium sp.]|jgi:BlaI family penicillinase repressor
MAAAKLGRVQTEIMRVLWRRDGATAREITDEMNASGRTPPIAHSTVQTLLRQMESKGAVTHQAEGRAFVFRAAHEEQEVTGAATRELLSRVFGGSVSGLVAHLLANETISPREMQRLRELVDDAEAGGKS